MSEFMNSPVTEEDLEAMEADTEIGKTVSDIDHQAFEHAEGDNAQMCDKNTQNSEKDAPLASGNTQLTKKATAADAEKKLDEELKKIGKEKAQMAALVVAHLKMRAVEDPGMAEDIMKKVKTLPVCIQYLYSQARKQATGNCAVVSDEVVYEWAEDYFRMEEKEKKPVTGKAMAKKTEKLIKEANKKSADIKTFEPKAKPKPEPVKVSEAKASEEKQAKKASEVPAPKPKKEKKPKETLPDGQMDLFSMFGL